ncbi:MAG: RsmB/NOP family class I SAM-dependent RNA methyltransferase [Burkholderiales bacterium]|nr:RsmB/NOP family class I SAM-dependent RNA methyltransferase [Burkholderiales bacterium]
MTLRPALVGHAAALLGELLRFVEPADRTVSRFFRAHRALGPQERAFVADAVYAVLRRLRSLERAAGSAAPRALVLAAATRVLGYSQRALERALEPGEAALVARIRAFDARSLPPPERYDLPDWLWARLVAEQGEAEAAALARALQEPAPLDLRVNLARISREEALARLALAATPTPHSPAGLRLAGRPAIQRHPLFLSGALEVQDEGSQLLAYLVAPRRGERVADFCAGAGGKALALAMLMRGTGRVYAMDVSARRLAQLAPRAARAGVSDIHPVLLAGENDVRLKRLAGKLDRVLVDAPCSGFGTLRRNPDLKWRHTEATIAEMAAKQTRLLRAGARLVKPGGRLVYATCSLLREENDAVADAFLAEAGASFAPLDCGELLAAQRIALDTGARLRLLPHRHGTDGFFAAAFARK